MSKLDKAYEKALAAVRTEKRARKLPSPAGWYYNEDRSGHLTYYGPFENEEAIHEAAYFHRSMSERDEAARKDNLAIIFLSGVGRYDESEVDAAITDPGDPDCKSTRLKSAKSLTMNPSWRDFSDESRRWIFEKDYEAYRSSRRRPSR